MNDNGNNFGDDLANKRQQKKEEKQQAGKEVAKEGAKMAANYFAGPVGGMAVDKLAKTKAGNAILNKAGKSMHRVPGIQTPLSGKSLGKANSLRKNGSKPGTSSAESKLQNRKPKNLATSNSGFSSNNTGGAEGTGESESSKQSDLVKPGLGLKEGIASKTGLGFKNNLKNKFKSLFGSNKEEKGETEETDGNAELGKMLGKLFRNPIVIKIIFILLLAFILISLFVAIFSGISSWFKIDIAESQNSQPSYYEMQCGNHDANKCDEHQGKFYKELDYVVKKYAKKGIRIDTNIIMSTLFLDRNMDGETGINGENSNNFVTGCDIVDDEGCKNYDIEEEDYKQAVSQIQILADNMVTGNELDYSKYQSYLIDIYIPKNYKSYILQNQEKLDELNGQDLSSDYDYQIKQVAKEIMGDYYNDDITSSSSNGGVCTYTIDKETISDLKVQLLRCGNLDGDLSPLAGESLIDFETYILGVVYQEVGEGASDETIKAQAVASRSFALSRGKIMGGSIGKLEKVNNQWTLSIRACTGDQAFCNPDKGCWSHSQGGEYNYGTARGVDASMHSGVDTSKYWSKAPLSKKSKMRSLVAETAGKIAVDSNGQIVNTDFLDSDQKDWETGAQAGKDYTQILMGHYGNVTGISSASCTTGSASTGEFSTWKQSDSSWSSIYINGGTIGSIGCTQTSVAMLIAKSGVDTSKVGKPFNPGTFAKAMLKNNGFDPNGNFIWGVVEKIVPDFKFVGEFSLDGKSKKDKFNIIKSKVDEGLYCVASVKNGGHWVAVDAVQGNKIIMMDPGSKGTDLWGTYNWDANDTIKCYKAK